MFGSEILEVAIGLVFVYLFASLACSGVMELIAKLLKLRSKHLKEELAQLLKSKDLVNTLYKNPLVKEISRGFGSGKTKNKNPDPDNIPTNNFVKALIDTLLNIEKGSQEFVNFEEDIKKIDDARVRELLLKALNGVRTQAAKWERWLEGVGESISKWFDHSMDKLSQWYKKQSRKIIFVIGILVVLVLNLDTIMIVKNLYQDETLRTNIVAAAERTVTSTSQPENKNEVQKELKQMGFPMGWNLKAPQSEDPRGYPVDESDIIYKIIGLLFTVMAISMGATFWVDLLRRLLRFRKDMKPTKEEKEKPKK
jgi:hypothetical protein